MSTDVERRVTLRPDAGLVASLGTHHTLESSLADLVDNCLDAGATRVSVRFVRDGSHLARVEVSDDGRGMDADAIDAAMTLGRRRDYAAGELGHFGVGLKAASLAHADCLTVWSTCSGSEPVGRRLNRDSLGADFECEVLTASAAASAEQRRSHAVGASHGTVVVWTQIRTGYQGGNEDEAEAWFAEELTRIQSHLGIVFHRIIDQGSVTIETEVVDVSADDVGIPVPVRAIDPFGYSTSGREGYPKDLVAQVGETRVSLTCHVWPGSVETPGFRLMGRPGGQWQGIYVYRHDRLLQVGGWSETVPAKRQRQLARVVLDDPSVIDTLVTMNAEKQGLRFEPVFRQMVGRAAAADGTTFEDYLKDAEAVYSESRRRRRERKPSATPGKGFAPAVRRTLESELPLIPGATLQVKWKPLPDTEFFEIDFPGQTVWLNQAHRAQLVGGRGGLNDLPIVKALVYLLTQHLFTGTHLGPRDKDDIALFQTVMAAALKAELGG